MHSLDFDPPLMNAAGFLGFTPDAHGPVELEKLGAFVTNPISIRPRKPAGGTRLLEYPGGALLHSGHPNPGFKQAVRRFTRRWERAPLPVIAHLLAEEPGQLESMAARLEELGCIYALEIGLRHDVDLGAVGELLRAAAGELPVIARLPVDRSVELTGTAMGAGAAAVSLGAPRGALPGPDGELVHGRLVGPALFPGSLAAVETLAAMDIPVIGAGGVYAQEQAEAMLAADALAVQLDAVLWRGGWR